MIELLLALFAAACWFIKWEDMKLPVMHKSDFASWEREL